MVVAADAAQAADAASPTTLSLRTPPPLAPEHVVELQSSALLWPAGQEYRLDRYATTASALDAYAAFHAASLQDEPAGSSSSSRPRKSLVFVPNQYGLGNRLRALKASLLVAMITGRVFHVRWDDPYPLQSLFKPARIDWRMPTTVKLPQADVSSAMRPHPLKHPVAVLCLPFATAPPGTDCNRGLSTLQKGNLREAYKDHDVLEIHTFTDLSIYLSANPFYGKLLHGLGADCPKRFGCLYNFLFSPTALVAAQLKATLRMPSPSSSLSAGNGKKKAADDEDELVGVQVRNRLFTVEKQKLKKGTADTRPANILRCMDRYVPPRARVFFTADDDGFYAPAEKRWGERLRYSDGGVFMPWSRGGKVDPSTFGESEEAAVLKAVVDWFALQRADRIVYTYQSSFGKTAAEASGAPNLDVNLTRCNAADVRWKKEEHAAETAAADEEPPPWAVEWAEQEASGAVSYDLSKVPGAKEYDPTPSRERAEKMRAEREKQKKQQQKSKEKVETKREREEL